MTLTEAQKKAMKRYQQKHSYREKKRIEYLEKRKLFLCEKIKDKNVIKKINKAKNCNEIKEILRKINI